MRTNIDIDDALVTEAMHLSGAKTKREVIDRALHKFVQFQRQVRVRELRGKIDWVGDLDEMRRD